MLSADTLATSVVELGVRGVVLALDSISWPDLVKASGCSPHSRMKKFELLREIIRAWKPRDEDDTPLGKTCLAKQPKIVKKKRALEGSDDPNSVAPWKACRTELLEEVEFLREEAACAE